MESVDNLRAVPQSLTAIAMASLVDQGLLGYGDRISQHWPQFQGGGKEEVTVADLMRHEAGLASLDTPVSVEDTWTENIKRNAVGAVIEAETCRYPDTGRRDYHSLTRGWVANEVRVSTKFRNHFNSTSACHLNMVLIKIFLGLDRFLHLKY